MISREQSLNPLHRTARLVPAGWSLPLSIAARALGVALALAVAVDQTYARTRAFSLVLAVLLALTLLPLADRWRARQRWWGAGLAFFGGACLVHLAPGMGLLAAGTVAAIAAALDDQRAGRPLGVAGFFTPIGMLIAVIIIILLAVSGS